MNASQYIQILDTSLVPTCQCILAVVFPDQHKFMQDNDPKHSSNVAKETKQINWWKTLVESPDLNPIENLWHELKQYIHREAKQELVDGIKAFWQTVDIEKCKKCINHLKKVFPRVIELNSAASGY